MIYKISGNQRLIWKFYKTDDNKWRWYCHEKMDIFCLNQITHIIRNCYALKMLKTGILRRIGLATFSTYFLYSGKRLEMVSML